MAMGGYGQGGMPQGPPQDISGTHKTIHSSNY